MANQRNGRPARRYRATIKMPLMLGLREVGWREKGSGQSERERQRASSPSGLIWEVKCGSFAGGRITGRVLDWDMAIPWMARFGVPNEREMSFPTM